MSIGQQFQGLPMDQLIGGPLSAAADASIRLANSTAEFISKVGFDTNGNVRNVAFKYEKRSMNDDGTSNLDEMKIDVPMLAIVPIPNLQVDEVNVLFDMEVKQSERSESTMDMGASITGTAKLGIISINVSGSVSAHQSQTRSSDNSAKYHVDVRATNHGIPEGLARVLDMMAANVAPSLVGSTIKDANGQELSEQERMKAEKLKGIRAEIKQIESRLAAAQEGLSSGIIQLKKLGRSQLGVYQSMIIEKLNALENTQADSDEKDKVISEYSFVLDTINQSWNTFQNQISEYVRMIADSGAAPERLSDLFSLKAVNDTGVISSYTENEAYYNALVLAQKNAVERQRIVSEKETELLNKRSEYSTTMSGNL